MTDLLIILMCSVLVGLVVALCYRICVIKSEMNR